MHTSGGIRDSEVLAFRSVAKRQGSTQSEKNGNQLFGKPGNYDEYNVNSFFYAQKYVASCRRIHQTSHTFAFGLFTF